MPMPPDSDTIVPAPRRTRRATVAHGATAKGLITGNAHWDVDLGSVQMIGGVLMTVEPGATLRNVWLLVSEAPLTSARLAVCLRDTRIWRHHLAGRMQDGVLIPVPAGTRGRYLRVQSADKLATLPLTSLDIVLPLPRADLSPGAITHHSSSRSANRPRPPRAKAGGDGMTLIYGTAAGPTYRIGFDLPAQDGPVFAWWNGSLCTPEGFRAAAPHARQAFEVVVTGTGSDDRLMFRAADPAAILPQNIAFKLAEAAAPQAAAPPPEKPVGTLAGILRRKPRQRDVSGNQGDNRILQFLQDMMGMDPRDEIVFR